MKNTFLIERKNGKKRVQLKRDCFEHHDSMELNTMTNGFQSSGMPIDEEILDMIKIVIKDFEMSGHKQLAHTVVDAEHRQESSIIKSIDDYIDDLNKALTASREGHVDRASYEISIKRDTMIEFRSHMEEMFNV